MGKTYIAFGWIPYGISRFYDDITLAHGCASFLQPLFKLYFMLTLQGAFPVRAFVTPGCFTS